MVNSIANLGGFAGPYAIGWIKDATGETTLGLVVLAAGPIMAGVVTFLMGHDSKIEMAGRHSYGSERKRLGDRIEPLLPVMAGLVPAIHALLAEWPQEDVDARDKRGHDEGRLIQSARDTL